MKIDEPESMKEIHRIREKLYEESKDKSPEEQIACSRAIVEELLMSYGLNLRIIEKTHK